MRRDCFCTVFSASKFSARTIIGAVMLSVLILASLLAPVLAPEGYDAQNVNKAFIAPFTSPEHILGTDNLGRDLCARLMYGARISLKLGVISAAISMVIGVLVGATAGYFSSLADEIFMRVMDIFQCIPSMLLAIAIAAVLGTGISNTTLAIGIAGIPEFARLARASVLTIRRSEYFEAAKLAGASDLRIIITHVLPNIISPILVQASLSMASAILVAASLSFIGLGAQPPTPEWGAMIASGREFILSHGYLVTIPGLTIMAAVVAFNLIGDGIRDALDPRFKSGHAPKRRHAK